MLLAIAGGIYASGWIVNMMARQRAAAESEIVLAFACGYVEGQRAILRTFVVDPTPAPERCASYMRRAERGGFSSASQPGVLPPYQIQRKK